MNKKVKKKWIEALRSGKYEQGIGTLRDNNNKFCCLGVLCDVMDPSKWIKLDGWCYPDKPIHSYYTLPKTIASAVHLTIDDTEHLVTMNDSLESDFNQIADWIETNIKDDK